MSEAEPRRAPSDRALAITGAAAGAFVLAFTLYWTLFPLTPATPLEGRFADNVILALELARTADDVRAVLGAPGDPAHAALRDAVDRLNLADFAYLVAYAALLACAALLGARTVDRRLAALAPLAVLAALADVAENVVLLSLTASDADLAALLPWLWASTYVKWELLAVVTFALGLAHGRAGGWRRLSALAGAAALASGLALPFAPALAAPLLALAFAPVWGTALWDLAVVLRRRAPAR
ncbi:MAG: hypothetical protein KF729_04895 [Sandaracinaceae bacterium]|nr:hypothetical protein [Sandaracinaceae bacterium]